MTDVERGVGLLLQRLRRLERDEALAMVREPLPADAVRSALAGAGIPATSPVLGWFAAWDGQASTGTLGVMDVLPGFYALSLEDALAHKMAQADWPSNWLPLLADGGGDFLVVDAAMPNSPVLRHRYDDPKPQSYATSLTEFLQLVGKAFEEGVIFVDGGYLEQDDDAWWHLLGLEE